MLAGTIRSHALKVLGFTSDLQVPDDKRELVNEIEKALVEVHNEAALEAAKVVMDASALELKGEVARKIRALCAPAITP